MLKKDLLHVHYVELLLVFWMFITNMFMVISLLVFKSYKRTSCLTIFSRHVIKIFRFGGAMHVNQLKTFIL